MLVSILTIMFLCRSFVRSLYIIVLRISAFHNKSFSIARIAVFLKTLLSTSPRVPSTCLFLHILLFLVFRHVYCFSYYRPACLRFCLAKRRWALFSCAHFLSFYYGRFPPLYLECSFRLRRRSFLSPSTSVHVCLFHHHCCGISVSHAILH